MAARGARATDCKAAVGVLGPGTPSTFGQWVTTFVRRLHELGWIEGRTVTIEYRWAEGRTERAADIAAEFVQRRVDVIVTSGTGTVLAAKQATSVIPIAFAAAGDPVGTGIIAGLARPGGNITGLSGQTSDAAHPGRAADQVRSGHQPNHRESPRPCRATDAACARRRGDRVKRREFITLLGGTAAWPLAAHAQQKLPTIGYLGSGTRATQGEWAAAFVQRLRELGWIDARTVAIEYRWAQGRDERAAEIAAEFVRRKVDVIVTSGTPVIVAIKQATSVIPIVFAAAGDPVGTGLVASLARPGGNATGLSLQQTETTGKRLELLREVVPGLGRLAILGNVGNPLSVLELGEVQAAARALGLEVITLEIRRGEDIAPAFEEF